MSKPKLAVIVDGNLAAAGPGDKGNIEGLGTAATKDVATNAQALAGTAGVLPDAAGVHASFKQYGYGGLNPNNNVLDCNDLPIGSRNSWTDGFPESVAVSLNLPALGGDPATPRSWHVECFGLSHRSVQEATEVYGIGTTKGRKFIRTKHDAVWSPWKEVQTTANILSATGQSTQYPMTQKATTDAIATAAQKSANLSDLANVGTARNNLGLGSAATMDVTTSSTDTTAGRVLNASHGVNLGSYQTLTGRKAFLSNLGGIADGAANRGAIEMRASGQTSAAMLCFHRVAEFAVYFGLDIDNRLKIGGWSMGEVAYEISHTGNILSATGQSTQYPMTQKATTDAINARGFADSSGVLTVTSGALSNDMSSFLSQTTKATMRSNLEVPQLNASATEQGGLKARLTGTTLYLTNNGTNP